MSSETATIQHVSDTAFWVAYFRMIESERPHPLFRDPFAKILVGERGKKIADSMKFTNRYTQWSVTIRTCIIDSYIQQLVGEGVDSVINLGAGLDTRPYRLKLPESLRWIEVDYPQVIAHKNKLLEKEKPVVQLERVSLDLSDLKQRHELFARLAGESRKVLILTEGVIPYLSEEQTASLAEDLFAQKNFYFWIAEYFSPDVYRYFKMRKRMKRMKNAPFRFFPQNWFDFFKLRGWTPQEVRYITEESIKRGRSVPAPWWSYLFRPFLSRETAKKFQQQMGYILFKRDS